MADVITAKDAMATDQKCTSPPVFPPRRINSSPSLSKYDLLNSTIDTIKNNLSKISCFGLINIPLNFFVSISCMCMPKQLDEKRFCGELYNEFSHHLLFCFWCVKLSICTLCCSVTQNKFEEHFDS